MKLKIKGQLCEVVPRRFYKGAILFKSRRLIRSFQVTLELDPKEGDCQITLHRSDNVYISFNTNAAKRKLLLIPRGVALIAAIAGEYFHDALIFFIDNPAHFDCPPGATLTEILQTNVNLAHTGNVYRFIQFRNEERIKNQATIQALQAVLRRAIY